MRLTTPKFWYKKDSSVLAALMTPASLVYKLGHTLNQCFKAPAPSPIPVICIGNITAGGAGKTPSACMVMNIIKQHKLFKAPVFLSRGYGRQSKNSFELQSHHQIPQTGDEAWILAENAPVFVANNRMEGMKLALDNGADCIVMDDGYQNSDIEQDLKILVVNSFDGFGNQKLIPAGPLREPLTSGIDKADIIFVIQDPRGNNLDNDMLEKTDKPVFNLHMKFQSEGIDIDKKYIAFTGIAQPEKFFKSLQRIGLVPEETFAFPDHHRYTDSDIKKLMSSCETKADRFVTTQKDYVRLSENMKSKTDVLKLSLTTRHSQEITSIITDVLNEKRKIQT